MSRIFSQPPLDTRGRRETTRPVGLLKLHGLLYTVQPEVRPAETMRLYNADPSPDRVVNLFPKAEKYVLDFGISCISILNCL